MEKIDYLLVNKLIYKDNNLLMLHGTRKIILVDASTNTENDPRNVNQNTTFTNE